ncbi:MAG TPA: cytochrome C oxidase subunit I [Burkholderiaceae bacterium]
MEQVNKAAQKRGRIGLLLVLAVCAAPIILSYLTYYVIKPTGRTNYGAILDPRMYPMPPLHSTSLDGKPVGVDAYKGKWLLLTADTGACLEPCRKKLFEMRQLRLAQGKHMDRVERVWLIVDKEPLDTVLMREYDGTRMLRVSPEQLKLWLPTEAGTQVTDHMYVVDPLGNLMMRFPKDADPNKIKKDLGKLLRASSIG